MGLIKCPRCELNYMLDTDKLCSVCRREVRGENEADEVVELCSECGENPVVPGQELCAACLKERASANSNTEEPSDEVMASAANIGMDDVSSMDEIEIDLDDDPNDEDFSEDADDEDLDDDPDEDNE